jgi:hypothetical protein
MRISCIRVRAVFAALLFGLAPGAAAQQGLLPLEGSPIAYRVNVPYPGWSNTSENGMMMIARDEAMIIVTATDLAVLQERPASMSEEQYRRILTERFMASDSVMMALTTRVVSRAAALEQEGLVQEVRTLGGQRAAYIRARKVQDDGKTTWRQAYLTVKDGIMYMLVFVVQDRNLDKHKDLFDRVHQSFELAAAPK